MNIQFIRQYMNYAPGSIGDMGSGICATLIDRGIAKEIGAEQAEAIPSIETADATPAAKAKPRGRPTRGNATRARRPKRGV